MCASSCKVAHHPHEDSVSFILGSILFEKLVSIFIWCSSEYKVRYPLVSYKLLWSQETLCLLRNQHLFPNFLLKWKKREALAVHLELQLLSTVLEQVRFHLTPLVASLIPTPVSCVFGGGACAAGNRVLGSLLDHKGLSRTSSCLGRRWNEHSRKTVQNPHAMIP